MDIYPTVKRSGKYLLYRLFWYITHIGLFVPMKSKKKKERNLEKKIKVNFHHIISEDKKGDKICSSNVDITSPGFLTIFDLDLSINEGFKLYGISVLSALFICRLFQ